MNPVVQPFEKLPWRTGRKVGRTIYAIIGDEPADRDVLIGLMDTRLLAMEVVAAHNAQLPRDQRQKADRS